MSFGMADLILHHYDTSPFSEKIRKVFAHKQLAWRAVEQPTIMPKPQLVPLTGGYRRIPVLQIGADIYCDSQLIVRVLEKLHPQPTLYPGGSEGICHAVNLWADRLFFFTTTVILFDLIGAHVPKEFIEDRTKLMGGRGNFADLPKQAPFAKAQCRAFGDMLTAQLADGRPFLLGADFSLADAACYHPVWFLRSVPGASAVFDEFAGLGAWADRVRALGHGQRSDMDPAEALRIARESTPAAKEAVDPLDANGLKPGMRVAILPDDYGFEQVEGEVIFATTHEIAIRRREEDLGEIAVHFPRAGFRIVT
jgi:glutathione S-transferase